MDRVYTQNPESPKFEKLLKGAEVAGLLGVSKSFVYLLMQSGEIPTVRLRHAVRVRPKDLAEYIEKNVRG
jgi:excisionase family DNA binding protein